MKSIWKLLASGAAVMFLLQSCVTVRDPRHHRHHRHHRHCFVATQPITDTTLFNLTSVESPAASEPAAYGNKE